MSFNWVRKRILAREKLMLMLMKRRAVEIRGGRDGLILSLPLYAVSPACTFYFTLGREALGCHLQLNSFYSILIYDPLYKMVVLI